MLHFQLIPVSPFQQNCSVIWDDHNNAAIIDAGDEADKIIQFVTEQQLNVQKLLVTHGHLDHIMAVDRLRKHFDVEVLGSHIDDLPLFEHLPEICAEYGFPHVPAFLPDRWLSDGDTVTVGELHFDVRHLPGHSPGHIGFFAFEEGIGFTGDVLFRNSIGRTDLYCGDFDTLIHTIRTKLFDLKDNFIIMPGHGEFTTIGQEKKSNPFLQGGAK